jgi:hypothetical protein
MQFCKKIRILFILILFTNALNIVSGQDRLVSGMVTDSTGLPVEFASIVHKESQRGTTSDSKGRFSLSIPSNTKDNSITISLIGYTNKTIFFEAGDEDIVLPVVVLSHQLQTPGSVKVTALRRGGASEISIPVSTGFVIPSITHEIESIVRTMPGVSTFSELSNQYSVRGGSYDENLVYIDGIETEKPYLIRYGQQEGLSQINPDFVSSVLFSPGGFSSVYGDRMSSVLDVKYRRPESDEASFTASLLTSTIHCGLISKNKKGFLMTGVRYKSNAMLVNSMDKKGEYKPLFTDIQSYGGIETGDHSRLSMLVSASFNRFNFIPQSQKTTFGSISEAYSLYAYFEGQEKDTYSNAGVTLTYESGIGRPVLTSFLLSAYRGFENETYDIRGAYSLDAIDETESTVYVPDSTLNIGVGSWIEHARNRLTNQNIAAAYKGTYSSGNSTTDWGLSSKVKDYDIAINEWQRVDSSGFTVSPDNTHLTLTSVVNNSENYNILFSEFYVNEKYTFIAGSHKFLFSGGVRGYNDTFTDEIKISPRAALTMYASKALTVHVSGGIYRQPVTGRELMQFSSEESEKLKSQYSSHLAGGLVWDFLAWGRPFRFTAELYGKLQHNLIPYNIENVRINYFGGNIAKGYTVGLDMRVNGEFVEGAESWFSLSFMKSAMEIPSLSTGWFPSPFDQRLNANIFFQDYVPGHPDFRVNVNIVYGTGVPTSPPESNTWDTFFRMPSYRRADIGFSKVIIGEVNGLSIGSRNSLFKELTAGVEIFNLADIRNTISYSWIKTVRNSSGIEAQYAVPHYLTSRRINLRITGRF